MSKKPIRTPSAASGPHPGTPGAASGPEPRATAAAAETGADHITLFTIGFAGKSAREFFETLQTAGVRKVIDIRLKNISQLAGFTKRDDLDYFLQAIAGIAYAHLTEFSPTDEILTAYKHKEITWSDYEKRFRTLLLERDPALHHQPAAFDRACLLCSEPTPEQCHRRLTAEYLRDRWKNVEIRHL